MKNTTTYNGYNLLEKNVKGWIIEESVDLWGSYHYLYMVSGYSQDSYRYYCVNQNGITINKESHLIKEEAKFSFDENRKAADNGYIACLKDRKIYELDLMFTESECDAQKTVILNELNKKQLKIFFKY